MSISFANFGQTKDDLQKQREKINKKISLTKELIKDARKNKEATNSELVYLNKQINFRKRLIENINDEIGEIQGEVQNKELEIENLENTIVELKEEYALMVYQAYKNRSSYDKLMYIFASETFDQAYKRLKVMQRYADVRKDQVEDIKQVQILLGETIESLEQSKIEKQDLLTEEQTEKEQLAKDKNDKKGVLVNLTKEEKKLKKQQQQQENERQKLNRAIQRIIDEELRAEKDKNNGVFKLTPAGKIVSDNFAKNKGNLPWPVLRGIITQKFGKQAHPTIAGITIESNGVDITTDAKASVLSLFDGEVTSVFSIPGAGQNVIITHGAYKTVYANMVECLVKKGDQVSTNEKIGTVLSLNNKNIIHLEIWKLSANGKDALNPEYWISK